jgi:hypothetical protein
MKKILLLSLALMMGIAVIAQNAHQKSGIRTEKFDINQKVGIEPVKTGSGSSVMPRPVHTNNGDNPNGVVNIITLGSSANGYGYGYWGGQKTMVWADDSLKAIINLHRLGPGATPPSFSGYLGVDLGINMGQQVTDWTNNWQIYGAFLNAGGTYYMDAARYPQGGIYALPGATSLDQAYVAYFAPNLSNAGNWGGYSYGRVNLGNQADSTKHLYWYTPPPFTYIPDGFTITNNGVTLATDIEQEWNGTTLVGYTGNLLLDRGVWNSGTNDFDYTLNTAIACPTTDNNRPSTTRIAASPDGQTVWIVTLGNNGNATQIGPVASYYPIVFQSNDGGQTWNDPIAIQLDGPDGIPGIVDKMLSDYRLEQVYGGPVARDEVAYTTAFDCDIVVDKWGNPHIGVVIGIASDVTAYSILTGAPGDSILGAYDIYSTDKGLTWQGVKMGIPQTFRGLWTSPLYEDNRVNIAVTEAGDKVFLTWLDTQVPGVTDNLNPDVFARGFDLVTNMITHNNNEADDCDNVTFLSDITQEAWFECTSHYVFTDGNDCIIPIVTEYLSDPANLEAPVTFKYISDFSYTAPEDYTISTGNPAFPVGIDKKSRNLASVSVFPNPAREMINMSVNLVQAGNVTVEVSNTLGQVVLTQELGKKDAGTHRFTLDAGTLKAGVYFCSAIVNGQKYTSKLIVE